MIVPQVPMSSAPRGQGRRCRCEMRQPSTRISTYEFTDAMSGASGNAATKSTPKPKMMTSSA